MDLLLVISNFDLTKFGCPHCGSVDVGVFIINGTCSIWVCASCCEDCAVVGKSVEEVSQFTLRDTYIKDLIGKHPYKDSDCQINSFSLRMNNLQVN